jgi:hypothetical protein
MKIMELYGGRGIEISPLSKSVALREDQAAKAISADKKKLGGRIASYVILSDEAIDEIRTDPTKNEVNILNMLSAVRNKGSAILCVKIKAETERNLRDILRDVMAVVRIIKDDIAKDIRGFVLSMSETSRSL